jgi:hypothetical protein
LKAFQLKYTYDRQISEGFARIIKIFCRLSL